MKPKEDRWQCKKRLRAPNKIEESARDGQCEASTNETEVGPLAVREMIEYQIKSKNLRVTGGCEASMDETEVGPLAVRETIEGTK